MAASTPQGSQTVLSQTSKQRTLTLKTKAFEMKNQVEAKVESRVEEFKEKLSKDMEDAEINDMIDNAFADVETELKNQLGMMKEEVKIHAPKKPVRKPNQSEQEYKEDLGKYEQDKADYMEYVGYVTSFLKGLADLFRDIFNKVRDFFRSLWNWIKQALKDIAKKVSRFLNFLKDQISAGIEQLFS